MKKKVAIKGLLGDSISCSSYLFQPWRPSHFTTTLPKDHQPLARLLQAPGAMVLECPVSCAKRNKPRAKELISPPPMAYPTKLQRGREQMVSIILLMEEILLIPWKIWKIPPKDPQPQELSFHILGEVRAATPHLNWSLALSCIGIIAYRLVCWLGVFTESQDVSDHQDYDIFSRGLTGSNWI